MITCHRSQGSEAKDVLVVVEDTVRLNSSDGRRWAYTAITRAKEKTMVSWI
jgi:ATP-dependent exoDNAse (exonuclease V) alpha subunit